MQQFELILKPTYEQNKKQLTINILNIEKTKTVIQFEIPKNYLFILTRTDFGHLQ